MARGTRDARSRTYVRFFTLGGVRPAETEMTMRKTISLGLLAMALVGAVFVATPAVAETPVDVLKALNEKAKSLTTSQTKTTSKTKNAYMESTVVSNTVTKREADGTIKFHTVSESSTTIQGMEPQKSTTLSVSDGKTMWTETDMGGTKQVMKMKVPPGAAGDLTAYIDQVSKEKATVLPDETINGVNCAVIQIDQADGNVQKMWFEEATGVLRKVEIKGPMVGESVTTVDEVKTGVAVDDSKFSYTPPAGVAVTDMTTM